MSFGDVVVDHFNRTQRFPYRSMLTGLFANALGWDRRETALHEELQTRIRYAARVDLPGQVVRDYQTVDFSPGGPSASELAWTTRNQLEPRKGQSGDGTHIRLRDYVADGLVAVAVTLAHSGDGLSVGDVKQALMAPARPLFLGRKCCLPSCPVFIKEMEASSPREALANLPVLTRPGETAVQTSVAMISEATLGSHGGLPVYRTEDKDWNNSIHVGRRRYVEERIAPRETNE